jgi:hypothetical protein
LPLRDDDMLNEAIRWAGCNSQQSEYLVRVMIRSTEYSGI